MRCLSTPAREAHLAPVCTLGRPLVPHRRGPRLCGLLAASKQQKHPERCVGLRGNTKPPPLPLNKAAKTPNNQGSDQEQLPFRATRELEKIWGVVLLLSLLKKAARSKIQQVREKASHMGCNPQQQRRHFCQTGTDRQLLQGKPLQRWREEQQYSAYSSGGAPVSVH